MDITQKMKIAAVGLAALVCGCNSPIDEQTSTLYVPIDCAKVKSLVYDGYSRHWSLTCETKQGTEVFYRMRLSGDGWRRYSIER